MEDRTHSFGRYILTKNCSGLVYSVSVALSWLFFLVYSTIQKAGFARVILFNSGDDTFMDFFNSCRDAAQGMGAYTDRGVIYPPLANLFYRFCGSFLESEYLDTDFSHRMDMVNKPFNFVFVIVMTAILATSLAMIVYCVVNGKKYWKAIIAFSSIISYPYLFLMERGNCLAIVVVLITFFAFFYNSNNKVISEVACVALALAAGLKLYPAFLGLFLLISKRWRQAIRTALYGLIAIFLPFVFYGGLKGIKVWIDCLLQFSEMKSGGSGVIGSTSVSGFFNSMGIHIGGVLGLIIPTIICIIAAFVLESEWQKHIAVFVGMLTIPGSGGVYSFTLLIIPLVYLINARKLRLYDYLYLLVIITEFVPYVIPVKFRDGFMSVNYSISGIIVGGLFILLVIDLMWTIATHIRQKVKLVSWLTAVIIISGCIVLPTTSVSASELGDKIIYEDITYIVHEASDEEIPTGFTRCTLEYEGECYPALNRETSCFTLTLLMLDDGNGSKLYTFDQTYETINPFLRITSNGIVYPILYTSSCSSSENLATQGYVATDIDIDGFEVPCMAKIGDESDFKLILLNEENRVAAYSVTNLNGFEGDITLYDYVAYPTAYPTVFGSHALAKSLNHPTAKKTIIICCGSVFSATFVIVISIIALQYAIIRKKKP